MKLFLFTLQSNYGEFIELIAANTIEEAIKQSSNLYLNQYEVEEIIIPEEPRVLFTGGGSNQ